MIQTNAFITKKEQLAKNIFLISLKTKIIANLAKPGQFVNILIENCTLRRPFSICEVLNDTVNIAFKVKGKGTQQMATWQVSKKVNLLGPLGNGFLTPTKTDNVLLIGGGIGCFALLELAKKSPNCHTILGFNTANEIILKNEFEKYSSVSIFTKNGSAGTKGLVTNSLKNLISTKKFNRIASCGPMPMMKAIYEITKQFQKIKFEVCLEERMACGIGACLGCQCKIKKNDQIKSKHVCCDGPVFEAKEVFFNE